MKVLNINELKLIKGIPFHPQHIRKLVKAGKFPRPIKIGENRDAFVESEIDAYIEEKIAARDAIAPKNIGKEAREAA